MGGHLHGQEQHYNHKELDSDAATQLDGDQPYRCTLSALCGLMELLFSR